MWRVLTSVLVSAALLCVLSQEVSAQAETVRSAGLGEDRGYLDYYVSRFGLAEGHGSSEGDAVGGRLMWSVAPLLRSAGNPWLERARVGGYLTHTPEDGDRGEMWRYGAQLDYILTGAPIAGRVEPLVSLGAGVVRTTNPGIHWTSVPYLMVDERGAERTGPIPRFSASVPERSSTSASLTPGIGARIRILPGLSLRTDARQVIDFLRDGTTSDLEMSAGVSVGM